MDTEVEEVQGWEGQSRRLDLQSTELGWNAVLERCRARRTRA